MPCGDLRALERTSEHHDYRTQQLAERLTHTACGSLLPSTASMVTHDSLEPRIIAPILQIGQVKLMRLESLPPNKQISNPKHVIREAGI